jgi:hypothetical protein
MSPGAPRTIRWSIYSHILTNIASMVALSFIMQGVVTLSSSPIPAQKAQTRGADVLVRHAPLGEGDAPGQLQAATIGCR